MLIKLAEASPGIERRTRLVVREIFKALSSLLGFIEDAGYGISGEVGGQTSDRVAGAFAYGCGILRRFFPESFQAEFQAKGIGLIDRKHANATLRTAGTTRQPRSAPARDVGESSVNDLNQLLVRG